MFMEDDDENENYEEEYNFHESGAGSGLILYSSGFYEQLQRHRGYKGISPALRHLETLPGKQAIHILKFMCV
jgi:hypothetical protein